MPCDRCMKRGSSASCRIMLVGEGKEEENEDEHYERQQHQHQHRPPQQYAQSYQSSYQAPSRAGSGSSSGTGTGLTGGLGRSVLPPPVPPQPAPYYAPAPVQHHSYGNSSAHSYEADRRAIRPPSLGRNLSDEQQASVGKRRYCGKLSARSY